MSHAPMTGTYKDGCRITDDAHELHPEGSCTAPAHPEQIMEWKPPHNLFSGARP